MNEGWSLRHRLLAALVSLSALLFAVSATQNYFAYRSTSDRLFDDSLRESAGLVMQLVQHEVLEHGQMLGIELLRAETQPGPYGFRFQVWTPDMQAGYLSSGGEAAPFIGFDRQGFASITVEGEAWRAFSLWNAAHTLQVQIAQRQEVRVALQRAALVRLVAGFAALLVAATVLIWWIVGASIRPLRETAASVAQRSEHDLGAVDTRWTPREVRPLLDALNRLLGRIHSTLAAERRFTSDAAHELRTPLAAIRANAQVLLGARDAQERDRTAHDLLESVDRGSRLVDQLLALARADRPGEGLHLDEVDLASLALEQERAHGKVAARLGVQLESHCDPAPARGDAGLLAVMIRNLLDNALRYSPRGGRVRLVTRRTATGVELLVEDEGPGIAPEDRERIFERFYRVAGSQASGSGLGLSIVQRIVEIHRGRIAVEEGEGGRGTRMRVSIDSGSGSGGLRGETAEGGAGVVPGLEPHLRRQA